MDIHEARNIVQKVLDGKATPAEKAGLLAFLKSHPGNEDLFPENEYWAQEEGPLPEGMEQRVLQGILRPQRNVIPLRRWATVAAAAVICFISYRLYKDNSGKRTFAATFDSVSVAEGRFETLTLPDGTRITLNGGSLLKWPKGQQKKREYYLDGEAFFDVAHDSLRPFIVTTKTLTTTVLGTSFDIRSRASETKVSVATGKVKVTASGQTAYITPGQQVTYKDGALKTAATDVAEIASWKDHRFFYTQTPLKDILKDLEAVYGLRFHVVDPDVLSCTYSTTFKDVSANDILETLTLMGHVHFTRKDDHIDVTGKACP